MGKWIKESIVYAYVLYIHTYIHTYIHMVEYYLDVKKEILSFATQMDHEALC